jgi:hypothetical protein
MTESDLPERIGEGCGTVMAWAAAISVLVFVVGLAWEVATGGDDTGTPSTPVPDCLAQTGDIAACPGYDGR